MTVSPPDLCLVSASGGSAFMAELMEVVAQAVRDAGGRARTTVGRFPPPAPDTVYLVVPHEYFVVTPDEAFPPAELCRRTIGFCVEHPGTDTFERSAGLVRALGAAVDINPNSTAELRRRGVPVEHFQLGYSPLWDHWGGDLGRPRHTDVVYLGTAERRRSVLLGSYAADLAHLRVRLLTPPHEMMATARVDFLPGAAKLAQLAGSRVLLNLHRERKRDLEWVRTLEAMCNGCVVVTEPSTDVEPLVAGQHLVIARPPALGAVSAALCADPGRERDLRAAAYEFVKSLDLTASARMLIELAGTLVDGIASAPAQLADPTGPARSLAAALRSPENALAIDTPSWDVRFAGERSLGGLSPSGGAARRLLQRTITARRRAVVSWTPAPAVPLFPDAGRADVDVLLVRRPGEPDPDDLVTDLMTGTLLPARVLVGEDGVRIAPRPRRHGLLRHDLPLGRGLTRNALLRRAAAQWLLVLDGGMRASRHLLERLLAAADSAGQARQVDQARQADQAGRADQADQAGRVDVVHCPVADPVDGLVGALPPENRRLRTLPYLGSGYLVRRGLVEQLGGWTEDVLLEGLEDHVFWRQVAAAEVPSALVQQVLLRRVRPEPEPRPLDLDPHGVWARVDAVIRTWADSGATA